MRNGPKGDTQFTPMPIVRRGLGELPRNTSLNPGEEENKVGSCVAPLVSTLQSAFAPAKLEVRSFAVQRNGMLSSCGCLTFHSDPTSTNADGLRPRLFMPELTGNSSSSRPM